MLDADNAGSDATLRGVQVAAEAAEHGRPPTVDWRGLVSYQDVLKADIRVIALPDGEDPDSLVRHRPRAPAGPRSTNAKSGRRPPLRGGRRAFDRLQSRARGHGPRGAGARRSRLSSDPVVRAHYVQQPRAHGAGRRAHGARAAQPRAHRRPAAVPSTAARSRARPRSVGGCARRRNAAAPPAAHSCGVALAAALVDPDTFEDSTNRRLFEAWRERGDSTEHLDRPRRRSPGAAYGVKPRNGSWDPSGWTRSTSRAASRRSKWRSRVRRRRPDSCGRRRRRQRPRDIAQELAPRRRRARRGVRRDRRGHGALARTEGNHWPRANHGSRPGQRSASTHRHATSRAQRRPPRSWAATMERKQ